MIPAPLAQPGQAVLDPGKVVVVERRSPVRPLPLAAFFAAGVAHVERWVGEHDVERLQRGPLRAVVPGGCALEVESRGDTMKEEIHGRQSPRVGAPGLAVRQQRLFARQTVLVQGTGGRRLDEEPAVAGVGVVDGLRFPGTEF